MVPHEDFHEADVSLDLHGSTPAAIAAEKLASEHFATWLDAELVKLVDRWGHLAAPRAKFVRARWGRTRR